MIDYDDTIHYDNLQIDYNIVYCRTIIFDDNRSTNPNSQQSTRRVFYIVHCTVAVAVLVAGRAITYTSTDTDLRVLLEVLY